jgi:uncharacterized repeat protein (TIGR01451 family)
VKRIFIHLTLSCILTLTALAEGLAVKLETNRSEVSPTGQITLVPVESAKPGEIIAYRAILTNTGSTTITGVKPEIPIPVGVVMVPDSATPKAAEGSLDGITFAPLPLLDAEKKPVPASDIRALRWPATDLKPAATYSVSVAVTVGA